MDNMLWENLDWLPMPPLEEVRNQAGQESVLFPPQDEITEAWVNASQIYHYLFGIVLKQRTGIEGLEDRIAQYNISPAAEDRKSYYQKYCCLRLRYFYVRGTARVDRLSTEDLELLRVFRETPSEETYLQALSMVERTFSVVMAVAPENPTTIYEPMLTLFGDYRTKGSNIPLAMRSVPNFTADGALESEEAEHQRIRIFTNIWKQVGSALSSDLGCDTSVAVEVFEP